MTEVNLKDAKSAFETFFNSNTTNAKDSSAMAENPASKVLNQVKANETNPADHRSITKVDASEGKGALNTMSVDEAESIIESKKSFMDILKELEISISDIFTIIDQILEKGTYTENHKIKSFEFGFMTKKIHSVGTINEALDGSKYVAAGAAGHLLLEHSMAASLTHFKIGKNPMRIFKHENPEDDQVCLEFIRKELSTPIYSIMVQKLQRFELMTGLSSREEALDHFLAHTQD